ncbi:MAG: peptide deformylase [Candidatus Saccharimonadales bacterium]
MTKPLTKTEFGNPLLRETAKVLSEVEILSSDVQILIADMYEALEKRKYGVGIAAPQLGHGLAINVIDTKPTATRPDLTRQKLTIINPVITKTYGRRKPMWEGCLSGPDLYAQVPRYKKVRLRWHDERAVQHEKDFDGFIAHVIQHEVDHLHGILFVDRVKDTKTYMTTKEYKKYAHTHSAK